MLTTKASSVQRMKITKTKGRQNGIDNIERPTMPQDSRFGSHVSGSCCSIFLGPLADRVLRTNRGRFCG
jgi:hypothetical protein